MDKQMLDNAEEVARSFYDWLIDMEYCNEEDMIEDIDYMIEDMITIKREAPMLFNLLRDISQ